MHRDGFECWRAVGQAAVWSLGIVMFPPVFDQDVRIAQRVEELTIEQVILESFTEAFAISVLPGLPLPNVGGLGPEQWASDWDPVQLSEAGGVFMRVF